VAGNYHYEDAALGSTTDHVKVPVTAAPASGGVSTSFTVTWAAGPPPSGFVDDVQIERPGSGTWVTWQAGVTAPSATFTPDAGTGTYEFRARLRNAGNGFASGYSDATTITVG